MRALNRRKGVGLAGLAGLAAVAGCTSDATEAAWSERPAAPRTPGASAARRARLERGVNLSHWFAQAEVTPERARGYVRAEELARLRQMGLGHVRLSVDPRLVFDEQRPGTLDETYARLLEGALEEIQRSDLAVVVDVHPEEGFKRRLEREDDFVARVGDFWRALAARLRGQDAERVFLELLNEPQMASAERWAAVQGRLLRDLAASVGSEIALRATMQEVAAEHRATAEARARTEAVLNETDEAMILMGPDGVYRMVNRRFCELFGVEEARVVGSTMEQLLEQLERVLEEPERRRGGWGGRVWGWRSRGSWWSCMAVRLRCAARRRKDRRSRSRCRWREGDVNVNGAPVRAPHWCALRAHRGARDRARRPGR